ncbi:IclR family transcriptional regulator [Caenimonas soli]|uniref:IclR family transcriptional regulator n=1 Tax=Caenimonas soli TaxID=2735555 RepID=UPI001A9C0CC8|nr:IclR family transcriptional regulator [Caenimonas soli]
MATGDMIERVLDILTLLADHPQGLPISDISRRLDLPKSAVHRLLSILVRRGMAMQDEYSQRYRMTVKLAALGFRFLAASGITDICQPSLDRLAARTGELVRLALVEDDALIWVAKAQGALSGLRYDPDMGQAVVLHATATGKAWLATLDETQAVALVKSRGFVVPSRFGRPIVRDEASLLAELALTRKRGWGTSIEEGEPGTCAVSCAIVDPQTRRAIGTVSVAGPAARLTPERMAAIAPDVQATAAEIADLWPSRKVMEAMMGQTPLKVSNG